MFGKRKRPEERTLSGLSVVVPAIFAEEAGESPLYRPLCGVPVAARTLLALNQISAVQEIVVVVREADIRRMAGICREFSIDKVRKVVCAREAGFAALTVGVYECERAATYIAIHDPLCPFVTEELLESVLFAAEQHGAAAPAIAVKDTIKIVADNAIRETPERAMLKLLQSPVVVESSLLKAALTKAGEAGDDMADVPVILEGFDVSLRLTEGAEENLRVGGPADIPAAEAIFQWR